MSDREKLLLVLLRELGGSVGSLDFQKLLFLYCKGIERIPSYEFVPYRFGGFSFSSYDDRRRLIRNGLLEENDLHWVLTAEGRKAAELDQSIRKRIEAFCGQVKGLRGDKLIAKVYRMYPYYTIRSEIADRILAEDGPALEAIKSATPSSSPGVCTIGYEGKSLDAYLNSLIRNGVTVLCDVRRNPLSRKPGFSKKSLQKACAGVRIRYEHLPELGIASEERRDLKTQADYDALFATYRHSTLPAAQSYLEMILSWVSNGDRVALTCFELLPVQCHRHCVAEALGRMASRSLALSHL